MSRRAFRQRPPQAPLPGTAATVGRDKHRRATRKRPTARPLKPSEPVFAYGGMTARRRRRLTRSVTAAASAAIVLVFALWAWVHPVAVEVRAEPLDADIIVSDPGATETRSVGQVVLDGVQPGTYTAIVYRTGFETQTVTVSAKRLRGAQATIRLKPLPQQLKVTAEPSSAVVRVYSGEDLIAEKDGSLATTCTSGPVRVEISAPGRNTWIREFFLDSSSSFRVRLDPEGQLVHQLALIDCAGAPKGVALSPDGTQAWTTILNGPPSIEVFSPIDGKRLGGVDIGKHGAVEVIFNREGTRAYASQMETAKVFEIDTATLKVLREFDTESAWTKVVALSPDGKTLFAANWSGDDVSEIDLATGHLRRRIRVADTPRGLWPSADGKTLWVAGFDSGDLERIDLATGKVKRVFDSRGALRHLVADEKRGLLFSSDMARDCVWVTDMKTNETRKFVDVDKKPNTIDLSPDGRVLFVSCRGENNSKSYYLPGPEWGSILLFDAETGKPLDAIVGGNQCTALDVSDDGATLVFSDFLDDRLRLYEVPPFEKLAEGNGGRFAVHHADIRK